jgi:CheY-like chemotaxis protein
MRILVVDDQPRARRGLKALLAAWDPLNEVREARNGQEAIQIVERETPSLILMDVRMPKMDGLEATRILKRRFAQLKIILLSMYPDSREEALAAGADAFVSKSDPPEVLRKALQDVIRAS